MDRNLQVEFARLSKLQGHRGSMTDIQTHLDKIRSDAAECLLLSNLFTDGKGEVFARTAEHLNALALEVGKTMATNGADSARAGDREEAVATDVAAAHHRQAARPRRMLPWLLLFLGVIAGAFFWANNPAKEYWSLSTLQSKHETSPAPQDETKQAIATLLSGEQAERKILVEQLGVLAARVDNLVTALTNLETALDNLKTARAEIAGPSNKEPVGAEEKPPTAVTKPSAPEEKPVPKVESRTSTLESPAAKQSDRVPPATNRPLIEPVDRVGAIPVPPRRAELDPRKPTIGPSGCTQFRSFDPVSGTYVTLDGRRRQCR
jgi:BA14K-like protein